MISKSLLFALVVAALASQPATAAVYDLRAASTTITMADGAQVQMWGFGRITDPTVSIPGPALEIPPGDDTLIINLTNQLPVPVSIVIPGIPAPLTPVWDDGTTGARANLTQRAVSFTYVAQPGQTVTYQWNNVQAGTYLYQSGTHPAVQVPMGLYGAVKHDAIAGQTYGVAHDRDVVLVYSEVDPVLNGAVTGGTYGTPSYPSTIGYRPRYFLINGQETSNPPALQQNVNERVLLRVINAGLRSIVPTLASGSMSLIAEDGQRAPFARESYSMLLPPGKTRDALLVRTEPGDTVLFDRRGTSKLARITAVEVPPIAVADDYAATEDTPLDTAASALPGVLANDTGVAAVLDSTTSAGTLMLQPNGSFAYAPALNFNGVDSFSYHATRGALASNVVTVSIHVAPVNDPPVAVANAFTASGGTLAVAAPGVLANDSDVDADPLSAELVAGPSGGTLALAADGSFHYTANAGTTQDSFTYQASDGVTVSNVAAVNITVVANVPPIAVNDFAWTHLHTARVINVVANDSDPDGTIDPASVTVTNQPTGGTATSLGNGTVRYRPRLGFWGLDTFRYVVRDNDGAVSAVAKVRVFVW
ncbi:MAG: tandem-95 repeat protein [Myxococcales bacterium]|nr:tandem-95 repeat protein [Myxococcales bacterium]